MRDFIGAMLLQDGYHAQRLRLGFGAVMNQRAFPRRMCGGICHAQQHVGELDFHATVSKILDTNFSEGEMSARPTGRGDSPG